MPSPDRPPPRHLRCGAHARTTGKPCQRFKLAGRDKCRLHGGRSTGATTPEGLAAVRQANLDHGAYAQLGPYQKALAAVDPAMFLAVSATTKLVDEIRFARAKLATLVQRAADTGQDLTEPISVVLTNLRLLIAQQHEIHPSAEIGGKFELTIKVVEGRQPDGAVTTRPLDFTRGGKDIDEHGVGRPVEYDEHGVPRPADRGVEGEPT